MSGLLRVDQHLVGVTERDVLLAVHVFADNLVRSKVLQHIVWHFEVELRPTLQFLPDQSLDLRDQLLGDVLCELQVRRILAVDNPLAVDERGHELHRGLSGPHDAHVEGARRVAEVSVQPCKLIV